MTLLIEAEDTLHNTNKALVQLSGHRHASGEFFKLDNVFDVIHCNSHAYYSENSDEKTEILEVNKLRELINDKDCRFVLWVERLIKTHQYIEQEYSI